jgi:hypothetical protein
LPVFGALYYWHGRQKGNDLLRQIELEFFTGGTNSKIEISSNGTIRNLRIFNQSQVEDCKDARIKFRIVPREIVIPFNGMDLLFDISVRPVALLTTNVNSEQFKDKIVIIGSTNRLVADYHFTPVGEIPGVFIVANVLNVLLTNSQIHESHLLIYILEAFTILLASWFFAFLAPVPAAIAMSGLFLLIVTPISLVIFRKWGIFLDFWLPVVGIAIHRNISGLEELLGKRYLKNGGGKMKDIHICLIVILCIFALLPSNGNCKSKIPIAKAIIPNQASPDNSYKLIREGESIKSLRVDMEILNGDIIIPHKGKTVKLIYRQTGCGEIEIKEQTTVNCNPADHESAEGFLSFLADIQKGLMNQLALENRSMKHAATTRGVKRCPPKDQSCLPKPAFNFSPWPINGTTALYGKPLFFCWISDDLRRNDPCGPATLMIIGNDSEMTGSISQNIKLGEFATISGESFEPGKLYKWYIERSGIRISDIYFFRVLSYQASKNIMLQLDEVEKIYRDNNTETMQSLYLQIISDASDEIDLYADSLRILMEVSGQDNKIFSEALDRVRNHSNY